MRATFISVLLAALLVFIAHTEDATIDAVDLNSEANIIKDDIINSAAGSSDTDNDNLPTEISDREFDLSMNVTDRGANNLKYRHHYRKVWVIFAANDNAVCYVQNTRRAAVTTFRQVARKYLGNLKVGTVVSIAATNAKNRGGLVASLIIKKAFLYKKRLRYRTYRLSTGRFPFRMKKAYRSGPLNKLIRTRKKFSCRWRKARPVYLPNRQRAPFPFSRFRARYVWARGAPRISTVYLRFVVGGEQCRRAPNNNGLPARCPCRKSSHPSKGDCLAYIGSPPRGLRPKFCRKRECEALYECVPRRRATGRCIRKYGYFRIKKLPRKYRGKHLCRNVRIPRPTAFMAPYA